jgi:hypothetical protein
VFKASRNYKSIRKFTNQDDWEFNFARFAGIALICFLAAGAALSVAYNEITLTLFALSAKVLILVERKNVPKTQSGFMR